MTCRKKVGRPPGPSIAYKELANELTKRLRAGEWPAGALLPSRRQLAARFGVGEQVVRLAMGLLQQEGRIALTARRKAVALNPFSPLSATSGLIALVSANNLNRQMSALDSRALHQGLESGLGEKEMANPLLIVHGKQRALRRDIPPDLLDLPLFGIFLIGPFMGSALRQYEKLKTPVMLVDRPAENRRLSSVSVDNEGAACDAVGRLVSNGHRRVALLRRVHLGLADIDADSKERHRGFLRGLKDAGLGRPKDAVFTAYEPVTPRSPAIQAILNATPPFTAVLAVDAGLAQPLEKALLEKGRFIPRDYSIVCFQSTEASPHFTGPRIDFFRLGRRAVEVFREAQGEQRNEFFPTKWEEGSTIARPRRR